MALGSDVLNLDASTTRPSLTLELIFQQHAQTVTRIIARLLGPGASEADVDDLCQQVFIAILRALPKFRGDSALTTWIYGISVRVVLQHLRGRRRYREMIDRFKATPLPPPPPGVDETIEQRRAIERVWSVLLEMKAERRVVFVLSEIEGLTADEIARALEISEAAVRSRLRRARAELDRKLARRGVSP